MGRQTKKGSSISGSETANNAVSAEAVSTVPAEETKVSKEPRSARNKKKKKKKHILLKILAGLVCLGLVGCIVVGAYVIKTIKSAPEIETDDIYSLLSQTSTIYDKDGNVIENIFGDKKRTIVSIEDIPEDVQNAFIAIEDKTFRTHHGFNIVRIFGAIFNKIVHGGDIGGTSTITQQLARNLYLEDTMSERSLDRKIKEAYYAYLLEQRLTKDQILEAY
ncbi:MAG: transglycosylase domain-containing protein, partial [Firmicutes bacterium]|nr:transglycosylase domain-containing protein [Bacillota bacterium]